ncbi:MotA/TolQ/ExbB proton channel family protein [Comamonas composti]|uniref:MotA/TolQ/ExbB proton channel family protein n=1 Tax=Comamonas composti TaxID=408558 RepID=UPI0003F50E47|nr:MotA/TolQ/ExbB proton channel family protein [Comamonas composti]
MGGELWHWFSQADAVARATAALLLLLSLASWVVMLSRFWLLLQGRRSLPQAIAAFWQAPDRAQAAEQARAWDRQELVMPLVQAVDAALAATTTEALAGQGALSARLTRGLREGLGRASRQIQWGQTLLATVGATAPFVGLLGTVWGIHQALAQLAGSGPVGIEQLAGPVGESLVMTAAGLAVALPAVLAYNLFGRSAAELEALLEGFAHDLQAMFGSAEAASPAP